MTRPSRAAGFGLLVLTAAALTILLTRDVRSDDAKDAPKPNPIEGAWRQVESKNGTANDYTKLPDGVEFIKHIVGGRFVWTVTQNGKIVTACGGKYTVDKDKFTESIENVTAEGVPASFVGQSFEFTAKVDKDTWNQVGTIKVEGQDFKIDEKWERCK